MLSYFKIAFLRLPLLWSAPRNTPEKQGGQISDYLHFNNNYNISFPGISQALGKRPAKSNSTFQALEIPRAKNNGASQPLGNHHAKNNGVSQGLENPYAKILLHPKPLETAMQKTMEHSKPLKTALQKTGSHPTPWIVQKTNNTTTNNKQNCL